MIDRFRRSAKLIGGADLEVKSLSVTLDDEYAPYVRGQIVCVLPDAVTIAALDPRQSTPPLIEVRLERDFGDDTNTIANETALTGGRPLSYMSANFGSKVSDWSVYASHYNGTKIAGQRMRLLLAVDDIETDERAKTLTLTIGGSELRLQEITSKRDQRLLGPQIRDAINEVLAVAGVGQLAAWNGFGQTLAPPIWEERQSGWDVLQAWLEKIDRRLIFNEKGRWRTLPRSVAEGSSAITLAGLKELKRKLARSEWYDSIEIWWTWETIDPVTGQPIDHEAREKSTNSTSWTKTLNLEMIGPPPSPASVTANTMLPRYLRKGERHKYVAPLDLAARPYNLINITDSGGTRDSVITAITLNLPECEMTITTREK